MSNQNFNSQQCELYTVTKNEQYLGKNQQYFEFPKIGNFQNFPIGKLTLKKTGIIGIALTSLQGRSQDFFLGRGEGSPRAR